MGLVVVSNRVVTPKLDQPIEGGLAAALLPAVENFGAIWVGSDNRLSETAERDSLATIEALGSGAVATVGLPKLHYTGYYQGFSNSALWPVLHSRTDLVSTCSADYISYRSVNTFMARSLRRFVKLDTQFWIHDYHFLPLGDELRRLGIHHKIGFFLHTPFPARDVFAALPHHRDLVQAMLSYDLIGFQTDDDRDNFADYVAQELGYDSSGDAVVTATGSTRLATFPIGIDADAFSRQATQAAARPEVSRLRSSLQGAQLAIGVDRIDYSKGLLNRLAAFDRLLQTQPALKRAITLLQIALPSRECIDTYQRLRTEFACMVSEINGRHGEVDWMPIRCLMKGVSQAKLAGYYRTARVGLVTSLHDGMNLVAKEYVAAQNPLDPGVLVLSRFTGAARQLDSALLVDPHDIDGLARAIAQAFAMSEDERRERWNAMMARLRASSLDAWFSDFVRVLKGEARIPVLDPADDEAMTLVPLFPRRDEISAAAVGNLE